MNTRKIIALLAIAIVAAALTTASVIAFLGTPKPATTATTYYEYYTIHITKSNGNIVGMMIINGSIRQVMYYTWRGTFMQQIIFG
jgi:hypothetical protein